MWKNDLGRFRIAGLVEGASLIILLFIAMPLKYVLGYPMAVTVAGSAHGILFIGYILFTIYITYKVRWSFKWFFGSCAAAFIPFGNAVLDRRIQKSFHMPSIGKTKGY